MKKNLVQSDLVESELVENLEPIIVQASIQIVVPTERELFCIIIEKIQQLDNSIVGTKDDVREITSSLLSIQEKLPPGNVVNKKFISVKEFENLYSIGEETQRQLRGRRKDSLPFVQLTPRGNVLYDVRIIDKWMENFEKRRN